MPDGEMPRPLTCFAIVASLLLHALILVGTGERAGQHTGSQTPLQLHLRLPAPVARSLPALPDNHPAPSGRLTDGAAQSAHLAPPRQEQRAAAPETISSPMTANPPASPRLNQENLRQQARQLGLERAESGVLRRRPPDETAPPPELIDRPILDALARRIGRPLTALEESTLPYGARRIRFSGDLCLDIPRHLPYGSENAFGPTLLVPKACAD